nr:MAG TPA: hypothetical protein [Caudoviricetes sp.]
MRWNLRVLSMRIRILACAKYCPPARPYIFRC